jgi:DNA-binding beta-propeller fold protein YncE
VIRSGLLRALCAGALIALAAAMPAWSASGTWERSWGRDVVNGGGTGFEICTVAADCKKGVSGGSLGGELNGLEATAVDAAGNVYVSNSGAGRVEKYDGAGHFEAAWGLDVVNGGGTGYEICTVAADCKSTTANDGTGGAFTAPGGIAVSSDAVWVADSQFRRIQKFDLAGHFELAIGKDVIKNNGVTGFEICTDASQCSGNQSGPKGGEFNGANIATDPAGNLYEADAGANRIQKFDSSGHFLAAWGFGVAGGVGYEICTVAANCQVGGGGNFGGTLLDPEGIATDTSGHVYVGNVDDSRIDEFDTNGGWMRAWGRDVIQTGKPGDLGVAYEICTVLADCKKGVDGHLGGEMAGPYGLAVAGGRVYEADGVNDRIQVFDTSGNFISAWGADVDSAAPGTGFEICTVQANCKAATNGGAGTGRGGELWNPHGISIGCGDALYVADSLSFRVDRFGDAAPASSCGGSPGGGGGGGGGGGPKPIPIILNGCLNADATSSGKTLGPAKLGLKTNAQRAIFAGADPHTHKSLDRYCAVGGGIFRIAYPTKKLLKAAGAKLAKKIKDRVVLIETSSPRFDVAGIHVGDKASTVHGTTLKLGHTSWRLLKGPAGARALAVIKGGKVVAVGLGDARLVKTKNLAKTYLTAWRLP